MATGIVLGAAAVGAAVGGATAAAAGAAIMTGIAIGWSVGAMAGSLLMGSEGAEGQDVEGPRLQDLNVQTSSYGAAIPIVYGSMRVAGNVIWSKGLKEHKHESSTGGGGKGGGGGGGTTTTYTYTCSFAVGICKGEIVGINRIWMDGKLFQDNNQDEGFAKIISGGNKVSSISVYTGSETQEPDPVIESSEGEGNVPGYRGLAYIVFEDLELGDFANRIPNIELEVAVGLDSSDLIVDSPERIQQFTVVGDGSLLVIQNDEDLFYYRVNGTNLNLVYHSTAFLSTALGKENQQTIIIQKSNNVIYTLSIPNGEEVAAQWNPDDTDLQGLDYGYVDGVGMSYATLENKDTNNNEIVFFTQAKASGITWCDLIDKDENAVNLEALVVYNGKVIANSFNEYKVYVYSVSSIPKPEKEITFSHTVESLDIMNGNLICGDHYHLYFYDGISNTPLRIYTYSTGESSQQSLDVICGDLLDKADLSNTQYDVSDLTDQSIIGFSVTKPMSVKKAIEPLMQAYQFDIVEADGKIICSSRGKPIVRSFNSNELAVHEQGADIPPAVNATRLQENQLPTKVMIQYQDQNSAYQIAVQYAKRVNQDYENQKTIKLPIVLTATRALKIAETLLATAWANRNNYSIQVLSENIDLLPGSTVNASGYNMRIENISTKLPGILELDGTSEEPSSYISDSQADSPTVPSQTPTGSSPMSFSVMMNLPGINRVYTTLGFFVAPYVLGDDSNWRGAIIYKTNDGGDTWFQVDIVTSQTLVATIQNSPGDGPTTRWDHKSSVKIVPLNNRTDLLTSSSELSVLGGANTAAIGSTTGEWEIISYTDVTDNGDDTYTLTGLIRGRRGTEKATTANKSLFVLLNEDGLGFVPIDTSDVGITKDYKVASINNAIYNKPTMSWIGEGNTIKPWPPVHIKGTRNADGDLHITWLRRSRGEESWKYGDVPMFETEEKYEIDILDNTSGEQVRTLSVSGENSDQTGVTYTADQQITDFGTTKLSVDVKIYQMSNIVGRGFPTAENL